MSLLAGFSFTFLGNAAYALFQFAVIVVMTRVLTVEDVGSYALAVAYTAPVFMLLGMRLRQVQVTDVDGAARFGEYFTLKGATSLVAGVLSIVIGIAVHMTPKVVVLLVFVVLLKAIEAQIDVVYGVFQRMELMHLVGLSLLGRAIVGFLAFVVAVITSGEVAVGVGAWSLTALLFLVLGMWRVARLQVSIVPHFPNSRMLNLVWLALPLGLSDGLGSLIVNVPRLVIEAWRGTEDLGVFAALSYTLFALGAIASSISEAAVPRLAHMYREGCLKQFRALTLRLCLIGFGLGAAGTIAAWLFGEDLLRVMYGSRYAEHGDTLAILMLSTTFQFSALFVGSAVNAMRQFRIQVPINIGVFLVVSGSALVLVPEWGLSGAAWSVVLGQVTQGVLYWLLYSARVGRRQLA